MRRLTTMIGIAILTVFLLSSANFQAEVCFDNMPPPSNASFAPVCSTISFAAPLQAARLTSPFGYRYHPISGKLDFHYGIDLAAKESAPIYAVVGGVVRVASTDVSYGKYVVIDHFNGFTTLYAHCSKLLVKKDQSIKGGEKLAEVGHTGEATGNHLHVEIRLNGIRFDPLWIFGDGEQVLTIPKPHSAQKL